MKKLIFLFAVLTGQYSFSSAQNSPAPKQSSYSASADSKNKNTGTSLKTEKAPLPKELTKSAKEIKGDKYYFIYAYDKAITQYAGEKNISREGQERLAKSYSNMNQHPKAEQAFEKLINMEGQNNPEDYFDYAMACKTGGDYYKANTLMDQFCALKPNDLRGISYSSHKSDLNDLITDKNRFTVKHMDINTDAEDFGTSFYLNQVVFASSRTIKANPDKSQRNGKAYLNLYVSNIKDGQLTSPNNFDKSLNGKMNEGPASFSRDGKFMAYTKNNYTLTKKELVVNLEIFFRTFENNEWSEPMPFALNSKDYATEHPCLTADGQTMYFSSNMPGGLGGMDIYKVSRTNGVWSSAENLGKTINTEGDEVFPFYQDKGNVLYFASNGHYGLGGLDIFSSTYKHQKFETVLNIGYPLNTAFDDFSLALDSTAVTGFFSSNRTGGKGDDDIYAFEITNSRIISGSAIDGQEKPVAFAFISLTDENNKIIDTLTANEDGTFSFKAALNKNFKLTGQKPAYDKGTNTASTFGPDPIVTANITMLQKKAPTPPEVAKNPSKKAIVKEADVSGFRSIYFDYREFTLRPAAKTELDKMIKVLNAHPDMRVELESHADCRASREHNQVLSEKRAKASADYLKKSITNPSRITYKGDGEMKPVNDCACEGTVATQCTEDAHQQNRRTDFKIVKN